MIENSLQRRRSRRNVISPSNSLRGHFFALARQVRQWADTNNFMSTDRAISVGVTSLERGVGASTVSFNLTCTLASLCRARTLLVEADFGRPYIARRLGYAKAPGLAELLLDQATADEVVFASPIADVSVMGCGQKSSNEALALPFDGLSPLLKEALSDYAFTIFDLPLASNLTACHSLAPFLDGVILTVDSNFIDQRRVERFKKQVEGYGVSVAGVVLNKS
jgi:Mrp family chromosome partitioning ATPase